ncbi:hypothetical protein POM88_014026 [Heracleum sosnowskyi]|uniref:Uncharacterized protein n=1 Tax=Heracleum sosnowskyi TaxID=360622 RepID=A0AAD8IZN0_9APIA|nr:hypothetical protein POM88_014026 [Heracleum sosnowskyi]
MDLEFNKFSQQSQIANKPRVCLLLYYGDLKKLWDELADFEKILSCSCGKCECNLASQFEKLRETSKLHRFLMGLNTEDNGMIRSQLLSYDPLPTLNRAYQILIQEERVRGIARNTEIQDNVVGFAVRTDVKGKGRMEVKDKSINKSSLTCTHCNRSGHDVTGCLYPDWWEGNRSSGRGAIGRGGRGSFSFSFTPAGRGCRGGQHVHANVTMAAGCSTWPNSNTHEAATTGLPGLSNEQWKTLLDMLGNKSHDVDRMTDMPHDMENSDLDNNTHQGDKTPTGTTSENMGHGRREKKNNQIIEPVIKVGGTLIDTDVISADKVDNTVVFATDNIDDATDKNDDTLLSVANLVDEHAVNVIGMDTDIDIYEIQNSEGIEWAIDRITG